MVKDNIKLFHSEDERSYMTESISNVSHLQVSLSTIATPSRVDWRSQIQDQRTSWRTSIAEPESHRDSGESQLVLIGPEISGGP